MKFYKMDDLCKLGYTAVEYLLKEKNFQPEEIGILLVNAACLTEYGYSSSDDYQSGR